MCDNSGTIYLLATMVCAEAASFPWKIRESGVVFVMNGKLYANCWELRDVGFCVALCGLNIRQVSQQ